MKSLLLVAYLALYGLCTSSAVVLAEGAASPDAPNLDAMIALPNTTTTHPTTAAHVTNTTAAHVTNTTAAHVTNTTAAHVTNTTAAHVTNTTAAHVTNTTAAHVTNTTAAHVTNTTAAHVTNTTAAHVTNTTAAHVTNTTAAHVTNTTAAHVTNTTAAHVTNTTAANHTTTMHAPTTVLPTLSPNFSLPITGHYIVSTKNMTCIKAAIGIQLIVKQKAKDLYFNIPPGETLTSGKCGNVLSWINLKFNSGCVNFTFVKDGNQYYVNEISAALHSMNNLGASYHGSVKNMKLFKTTLGHAYKCKRMQVVAFKTSPLQILVVDTLLQAFDVPDGKFGKVEECNMDYKIIAPIIFGVALFVLIIIVIIVYLVYRHRRVAGYQRI